MLRYQLTNDLVKLPDLQRAIKNMPKTPIENSKEYRKVMERNKKLQEELDEFLTRQDELTEGTRKAMNLIEEERRRKEQKSLKTLEIKGILQNLKKELKFKEERREDDQKIIEELKQQIDARDELLVDMRSVSALLSDECQVEYERLKCLKNEIESVGSENQAMLKLISRMSQETLQKLWYTF